LLMLAMQTWSQVLRSLRPKAKVQAFRTRQLASKSGASRFRELGPAQGVSGLKL
jgi:hypothetical protein